MHKPLTVLEAKYEAQKLAFGPFFFQAIVAMRELGVLTELSKHRKGLNAEELQDILGLSPYGLSVLTEAGQATNVLYLTEDQKYKLTKVGVIINSDQMTDVNINFTKDVCYDGLKYLKDSIQKGSPEGLQVFGNYKTIYHGLASLDDQVRKSWFNFDHYYSTDSFPSALEIVFTEKVNTLYDIGGNTGKWTIQCCTKDENIKIKIIDLPGQIETAKTNLAEYDFIDRVSYYPCDMLIPDNKLPNESPDVIWMSQFLDCFSFDEILQILNKVYDAATEDTTVYIMESFWDNQRYEAGSYSIIALSLYFTCLANGNSKMFKLDDILPIIEKANFDIVETYPLIGNTFNTILKLKKR